MSATSIVAQNIGGASFGSWLPFSEPPLTARTGWTISAGAAARHNNTGAIIASNSRRMLILKIFAKIGMSGITASWLRPCHPQ
jgi:hypothetical protein